MVRSFFDACSTSQTGWIVFIACARHPTTFPSSTSFRDAIGLSLLSVSVIKCPPELCFMKAASFPTSRPFGLPFAAIPMSVSSPERASSRKHRTLRNLNDRVWWSSIKFKTTSRNLILQSLQSLISFQLLLLSSECELCRVVSIEMTKVNLMLPKKPSISVRFTTDHADMFTML